MANTHKVSFKLNGKSVDGGGRAARAADPHAARAAGPHRAAHRLRDLALRRLHGGRGRHVGQVVHRADGAVRRRRHAHRRGPGAGRRAACAAAGLPRGARPAMRLLHARHADARLPAAARRTRTRASRRSATASPATCAAAPATRTSSRRCSPRRRSWQPRRPRRPDAPTPSAHAPETAPWATCPNSRNAKTSLQGMGTSLLRKEDARFIRGQGSYVDDIKLPGMLFGAIVRSPYAHARIKSIDKTKALACAGRGGGADRRRPEAGQPALDAHPGRRRAGRAGRQEGLLPDAGSGDGAGHRPLRRRRRRRAGRGRLRGTAGDRRPEASRWRRTRRSSARTSPTRRKSATARAPTPTTSSPGRPATRRLPTRRSPAPP